MLMRYSIQDFTTREIEKNQECYTITDIIIRKAVSFQNEKSDKIPKPNYQKWSPQGRPWPRGLKSSKIGLSLARGQHYFLNC